MKALNLRNEVVLAMAATVGILAAGVANADYFERNGYEDEMNRCIDLIQPSMQAVKSGKVIYDVQEIDLRGPWYQFEISVTVEDEAGARRIDGYKVGCKSNRWIETAELKERRNTEQLPVEMELLASK